MRAARNLVGQMHGAGVSKGLGVPAGERAHEQSGFPNQKVPWGQDAQVGMGSRVEMGTEREGGSVGGPGWGLRDAHAQWEQGSK